MPAPTLRRYAVIPGTADTDTALVPAVPAARALVIGKLIVANVSSTAASLAVIVAGTRIASGLVLQASEVYTEAGLIVLAGETIAVRTTVGTALAFTAYGEEVDNL